MLPKLNRLTKKKDFDIVFRGRKNFRGDFLALKSVENNLKSSRFGLVVSKKISPKAVERNKIKRRLRQIIFSFLKEIKKPTDVVLMALPSIKDKSFIEIKKETAKILKKAGVI
ncbi:MAG: ribonuclease P protein component [Patescibacteria group bacterium]